MMSGRHGSGVNKNHYVEPSFNIDGVFAVSEWCQVSILFYVFPLLLVEVKLKKRSRTAPGHLTHHRAASTNHPCHSAHRHKTRPRFNRPTLVILHVLVHLMQEIRSLPAAFWGFEPGLSHLQNRIPGNDLEILSFL